MKKTNLFFEHKQKIMTTIKIFTSVALIIWLVRNHKLDYHALEKLWNRPKILASVIFFWSVSGVTLCALRWRALVMGMSLTLSKFQAVRINLIGLFFNTVMPGAVGGDFIKAIYVCKGQDRKIKVPVLLTILLDRIIGMVALFLISMTAILMNWNVVMNAPLLKPFVFTIFTVVFGLFVFVLMVALPARQKEAIPFLGLVYKLVTKFEVLKNIYHALRGYKSQPQYLMKSIAYSIIHQLIYMTLFYMVTTSITEKTVEIGLLATVLPLGIVTTAIPLAPGGMGIGHVAFEKLFGVIGLTDGANIFNIIFFGLIVLNFLGLIPYIFMRGELGPLMKEETVNAKGIAIGAHESHKVADP